MRLALEMPLPSALPERWASSPTLSALRDVLATVGVATAVDPRQDFEDAVELAARTVAAVRTLPALGIAATVRGADGGAVRIDGGDPAEPIDVRRFAAGTGAREARVGGLRPSAFDANPPYWSSPAFGDFAGRAVLLCRNSDEGDSAERFAALPYVRDAVAAFGGSHGSGPERRIAHKYVGGGLKEWPVTFAPAKGLMAELGYANERFFRGACLLQEVVDMGFEYRFLVAGWRIVGGSATRPDLTADDADPTLRVPGPHGAALDARPFEGRGAEESKAIVRAHAAFAEDALRVMEGEATLGGDMTLDVFVDRRTGRRGVVEVNPVGLAGWFAADPAPVVAALGARALALAAGAA